MATLKKGSNGEEVKQLQKALGLTADGIFGANTEAAVKKFQKENGLDPDGIVGPKTAAKLSSLSLDSDLSSNIVKNIDIENYYLPKSEYLNGKYANDYIVLHHTAGWDNPKQVVDSWASDKLGRVATEFVIGGQRCTDGRKIYDGQIIRAFPEGNQAGHIGKSGSSFMNNHSVGIELCNFGYVDKGKTYTGANVIASQQAKLKSKFRGYDVYHRYSDAQLKACKELLEYISKRDNIDLHTGIYKWIKNEGAAKAFEYHADAYNGKTKGLITHANIRKDKFDVFPQDELVDMILSL